MASSVKSQKDGGESPRAFLGVKRSLSGRAWRHREADTALAEDHRRKYALPEIAARLLAQHAGVLESRRPVVDEAVIGSMGTFYRVRIAPYRTADEARQTCKSLKSGGFDCLVVTK